MTRLNLILAIIAFAAGGIVACSSPKFSAPPKFPLAIASPTVSPLARQTTTAVGAVQTNLAPATQIAPALTPANVDAQRPVLVSWLAQAWDAAAAAMTSAKATEQRADATDTASAASFVREQAKDKALGEAGKTIEKANKAIADRDQKIHSMQDGKVQTALWAGIVLCVLAAAGGAYLAFKGDLTNGLAIAGGGAVGITFCILSMTLENFAYTHETEIGYGACALAVAALAGGGYLAYRRLHEATGSIIQANQAAIVAGAIPMSGAAPIFRAVQSPLASKLVNRWVPKGSRHDLNGPGNVAARLA